MASSWESADNNLCTCSVLFRLISPSPPYGKWWVKLNRNVEKWIGGRTGRTIINCQSNTEKQKIHPRQSGQLQFIVLSEIKRIETKRILIAKKQSLNFEFLGAFLIVLGSRGSEVGGLYLFIIILFFSAVLWPSYVPLLLGTQLLMQFLFQLFFFEFVWFFSRFQNKIDPMQWLKFSFVSRSHIFGWFWHFQNKKANLNSVISVSKSVLNYGR